ncbi:MAG TPA: hypothetical protein ENJ79_03515 [Gammaproteobacteria bacterium]|nr:hypothetical protein [Gammaproteobacteria bacterium]
MASVPPDDQARCLIEYCPVPLLALDAHGRPVFLNQAFRELTGLDQDSLPQCAHDDPVLAALGPGAETLRLTDRHGRDRQFDILHRCCPGEPGLQLYCLTERSGQAALEAENEHLRAELARNTLTDEETGLLNLRGLMLALEPQVARCRRYERPLSLLALDIEPAHEDARLRREIARVLRDQLRWADLIASAGTGRFILILPETGADSAARLGDKLDANLHRTLGLNAEGIARGLAAWTRTDNARNLLERVQASLPDDHDTSGTSSPGTIKIPAS